MQSILEGVQIINETMIKTIPEQINDQIVIYMDTYDVTYEKIISGKVVCCSTCKIHSECQNATALDLKKRQWHCLECVTKRLNQI